MATASGQPRAAIRTVLVVDDDQDVRAAFGRAFHAHGFDVRTAGSLEEALVAIAELPPDLAVIDYLMPDCTGLEVLARLKENLPNLVAVIVSGVIDITDSCEAGRLGAAKVLRKPARVEEILAAVCIGPLVPTTGRSPARWPRQPSLARLEWLHVQRILQECNRNVSKTARVLGMQRQSLQRKLKKGAPEA